MAGDPPQFSLPTYGGPMRTHLERLLDHCQRRAAEFEAAAQEEQVEYWRDRLLLCAEQWRSAADMVTAVGRKSPGYMTEEEQ